MNNVEKIKPTGLFTNYIFKAIPLAFDESMSYYETLCGLLAYLKNTVMPVLNNNADAIIELQNLIIELQEYVNNYFENLDVQEEINNKLDEMAKNGQLADIIAQYLQLAGVLAFNTVNELKNADNIVNGSIVCTLGYHSINDGGKAFYKIRNITNNDVVDESTIIALSNPLLIAQLIYDTINVNQFGAYGDGIHDDTEIIQKAFDFANKYNTIEFNEFSTYLISQSINVKKDININGNYGTIKLSDNFNGYAFRYNVDENGNAISIYPEINAIIKNIVFSGNENNFVNNNGILLCQQVEITEIRFENINKCIYFTNDYIDRAEVHNIYCNNRTGTEYAIYTGNQGESKYFHHIQCGGLGANINLIKTGNNNVHVMIENTILGSLEINTNAILRNIMLSYYGIITITGADVIMENVQYSKNKINERRIIVNADGRKLPNIEFTNIKGFYINNEVEYDTTPINSILINNCNSYKLTNVYSGIRYGDSYKQVALSFDKIDFGESVINNLYNKYPIYFNNKLIYAKNYQNIEIEEPYLVNSLRTGTPAGKFKGNAGTYYYRWACGIEINNRFGKTSNEVNITINDTNHTPRIELNYNNSSHMPESIRIYRGTSTGNYTEYADITYCNDIIIDNGISVNGILWRNMSSDNITYINMDNNTVIKHLKLESLGSNTYIKKYTARYNPITKPSWFSNGTYEKGTLLYDYNGSPGLYLYDGTSWSKITN